MKKIIIKLLFIQILLITNYSLNAQLAISNNGNSADASAILDVTSTNKGLLLPRMTQYQLSTISSPANSLLVFNTTDDKFYIYITSENQWKDILYGASTITPSAPVEVTNTTTGKIWMAKNLGASQVATSSTDAAAYGDLYQWGRATDGHESRSSSITSTNATTAVPNFGNSWDSKFITESVDPGDWLIPQDNNLWQGVNGINNPCPSGYRLPTLLEWEAEIASWASSNAAGAFGSALKLTVGGSRIRSDGSISQDGSVGYYWSSDTFNTNSKNISISSSSASSSIDNRAFGNSIRCIKN